MVERTEFGVDVRPGRLHEGGRRRARAPRRRSRRDGRLRHDPLGAVRTTRSAARAVNTHPALLPAFKGWHAVRDALAAGVKVTGCTVHLVTEEVDAGPILAQEAVPVLDDDTEATLHERIKQVERRLYPDVIEQMVRDAMNGSATVNTKVQRALLSVWDKTGLVDLRPRAARARCRVGVVGRHRDGDLPRPGMPVTTVEEVTGVPEMLDHRVVTLHPKIHGGLLADRGQGIAPRRPGDARHPGRSISSCRTSTRSSTARHRDHRHRRSGDDACGGEEPRVGHDRHQP